MIAELGEKGPGLRFTTVTNEEDQGYTRIPCLAFTDYLVLLAEFEADMQQLLDTCAEVAHQDGFRFNKSKTRWMAFNSTETASFHIGNAQLKETTAYTYLEIKIQNTNNYLAKHEAAVVAK